MTWHGIIVRDKTILRLKLQFCEYEGPKSSASMSHATNLGATDDPTYGRRWFTLSTIVNESLNNWWLPHPASLWPFVMSHFRVLMSDGAGYALPTETMPVLTNHAAESTLLRKRKNWIPFRADEVQPDRFFFEMFASCSCNKTASFRRLRGLNVFTM